MDTRTWDEQTARQLIADGDPFQTVAVAVVFIPHHPLRPPAAPRIIQQRGERNYFPELGTQVSIDEGAGRRTRGVVTDRARYHAGSVEEVLVLIVTEFFGPN
jgi:hypothetical protein